MVVKSLILTEIHLENRNNGELCAACHHVEQFEGSSDASWFLCMHLPPLLGKWIAFPGAYSSVDDRWGGFCVCAAFMCSATMKGMVMYNEIKESNQRQFQLVFIEHTVVPVCAMKAYRG
jgi:hypothetical protein